MDFVPGGAQRFLELVCLLHRRAPSEVDIARHSGVLPSLVDQMLVRLKERELLAHTPGQPGSSCNVFATQPLLVDSNGGGLRCSGYDQERMKVCVQ